MNIVIVMPLAEQKGGSETALIHLMQQGRNKGVNWTIAFLEDGPMVARCQQLGATCEVIPAGRLRQPVKMIGAIRRIAKLLKRQNADLVTGWMSKAQLYAGPAGKLAGVRAAWFQHGLPVRRRFDLDWFATKLPARGVFTCSAFVAAAQAKLSPSRPTRAVHPGAELERFDPAKLPSPAECRRKLGLPESGPLIGMTGRLQTWKGMHVLIDATAKLLLKHPDLHCVIVGGKHDLEPDYPAKLQQQIERLGLQKVVIMAGPQQNVPEWVQAMDVPVHASQTEPFGIVVIEAMALAKPLVAGSEGGPTEVITPGVNGLLAPYGDADALAKAIGQFLDDPAYAKRVGEAARVRALEFSTERFADNFIAAAKEFVG
jgi:glycosyltransferase involved in cell wall biosynthesis